MNAKDKAQHQTNLKLRGQHFCQKCGNRIPFIGIKFCSTCRKEGK